VSPRFDRGGHQTATKKPYPELDPKTGKPLNLPVNVVRVNPIENPATQMNAGYQKLLAGSVWANYSLVATQWAGNLGGLPKPAYMANAVIETYTQGPKPPSDGPTPYPKAGYNPFSPNASSSCMKCHSVATTPQNANADFSSCSATRSEFRLGTRIRGLRIENGGLLVGRDSVEPLFRPPHRPNVVAG
jgi:hypothetical protein